MKYRKDIGLISDAGDKSRREKQYHAKDNEHPEHDPNVFDHLFCALMKKHTVELLASHFQMLKYNNLNMLFFQSFHTSPFRFKLSTFNSYYV